MNAIALQRKHLGFSEPDALEIINEALEEQAGLDLVALRALAKRDDRMLFGGMRCAHSRVQWHLAQRRTPLRGPIPKPPLVALRLRSRRP